MSRSLGLEESRAKVLADLLIDLAVDVQNKRPGKSLKGRSVLVVGGSGRMGEWTCRFFSDRGANVKVWDPRGRLEGYQSVRSISPSGTASDFVVVASPLGKCQDELEQVLKCSPKGIVFDLCSVKAHIYGVLKKAATQGILVTSVHPMFGPSAATPNGRNVIVCDCGNAKANKLVEDLFRTEGARVSTIALNRHDELMAYVLGLSHLCSLLFAGTLARSGKSARELSRFQGTSYAKMTKMARELTNESKRVYHDIQSLNPHTRHMVATMEGVLRDLKKASLDADSVRFSKIMESNKEFLEV